MSDIKSGDDIVENIKKFSFKESHKLSSNVPKLCTTEPCILGIDEAGRGPVLGPMVYGLCYVPKSKSEQLQDLGCADSKVLTEQKREDLFTILCSCDDFVGWSVDVISPNFICNKMLKRSKVSLNDIAQSSTVSLIENAIESGVMVSEIFVDTVGPPEKYQERLSKFFPDCKVTVSKKADSLFPIVSAASICAKVARDRCISNWIFPEGVKTPEDGFGSGYPNDPLTKKFLSSTMDQVFGFPQIVRFSWSTSTRLMEDSVPVGWEDENEAAACAKPITSFFKAVHNVRKHEMKHKFFTERHLSNIDSF